ncbi:CRP/FNR family transcriptional regulator, anaerobic regulatory protein [Thermosulfidibacter takaii ABI70S6]|uniref:CRP/FNR family transcriptional regulator, anaerobic regulatory protein n=1 Tax=Thermosulfidibacter takaii (strain DSM 17441 / JCM 13301 / NBRC 103674 / ABI70S6) TaxID=1298851 RepID=A0A0S3QT39_THET7|nr:Crp/Fnr family transcriptional regulator [Thermosulfidibacter takaii]BAT71491.1 CRP/FNR family transcriptional regulator, anaerobic regulatory protein [Thermosulfidibacter takaii ABI70S6]
MQDRQNIQDLLSNINFFSGLPQDVLEKLSSICEVVKAEKGRVLFSQGEKASAIWGVVEGRVKIYKISANGKEQILTIVHKGDTFAEVAVLKGSIYPAFAEVLEDAILIRLDAERFLSLVQNEPVVAFGMMAAMAEKLNHLTKLVENISLKEVPARLASYLLNESKGNDVLVLKIAKGELAKLLGTTPETLSRSFKRLAKAGVIEVRGALVKILDRPRLEEISEDLDF